MPAFAHKELSFWDQLYSYSPCALLASTKADPSRADACSTLDVKRFNASFFDSVRRTEGSSVRRTVSMTEEDESASDRASQELQDAMASSSMFGGGVRDPHRLRLAIAEARAAGVDEELISQAEFEASSAEVMGEQKKAREALAAARPAWWRSTVDVAALDAAIVRARELQLEEELMLQAEAELTRAKAAAAIAAADEADVADNALQESPQEQQARHEEAQRRHEEAYWARAAEQERKAAEQELAAAMPGWFGKPEPSRLAVAIRRAESAAGTDPSAVAAAKAKLGQAIVALEQAVAAARRTGSQAEVVAAEARLAEARHEVEGIEGVLLLEALSSRRSAENEE